MENDIKLLYESPSLTNQEFMIHVASWTDSACVDSVYVWWMDDSYQCLQWESRFS